MNGFARIFQGKSFVIQVIDTITNAKNKVKMMMAIFDLHGKYFEEIDFDSLFLDILEPLIIYQPDEEYISYLHIATEIITDDMIPAEKIKNILLSWIYNEPFCKAKIMRVIPGADIELLGIPIVDVDVEPVNTLDI
jgi:hypothetical protein